MARQPVLKKLLIGTVPVGSNVGQFSVQVLGIQGNSVGPEQFTYNEPPQELVVSKSATAQLSIVDPIIKQDL